MLPFSIWGKIHPALKLHHIKWWNWQCKPLIYFVQIDNLKQRLCSDWCSHLTVPLNERCTLYLWSVKNCGVLLGGYCMLTCIHCQVSAGCRLIWAVGFDFEDPCDFMWFYVVLFFNSPVRFPLLVRTQCRHNLYICLNKKDPPWDNSAALTNRTN